MATRTLDSSDVLNRCPPAAIGVYQLQATDLCQSPDVQLSCRADYTSQVQLQMSEADGKQECHSVSWLFS